MAFDRAGKIVEERGPEVAEPFLSAARKGDWRSPRRPRRVSKRFRERGRHLHP
jgi:hypothetical protein